MKNEVHEAVRPPAASDAALRERLRASLSEPPETELQALEERVMAQWQLRVGAAGPVPQGRGGFLLAGLPFVQDGLSEPGAWRRFPHHGDPRQARAREGDHRGRA